MLYEVCETGGVLPMEVGNLRKGDVIVLEGQIYRAVEVNKHKVAMGRGMIRSRLKNVVTGYIFEKTFTSGGTVEEATLTMKNVEYLYNDGGLFYFMDLDTYDQIPVDEEFVGDAKDFMIENIQMSLLYHEDTLLGVQLPNTVVLKIVETDPNFKGDTVSGGGKPAVLETGYKTIVPMFVGTGEKIKVDTRTGEYIERA
jgi:elongation factor P